MTIDDVPFEAIGGKTSIAQWVLDNPETQFAKMVDNPTEEQARDLLALWDFWCRPDQREPGTDWSTWLVMAGRGFGKTRMGAEWVRKLARKMGDRRIALVGATMAEVRAVMVEGESGLLNIGDDKERPEFEPSLGRLHWRSGATAYLHSATEPDSLRGPQFDAAWCDEIAKWPRGMTAWSNLQFATRLGDRPRIMATTTPRRVPLVRALVARPDVAISRGKTRDNRAHLPRAFLKEIEAVYAGTRLGRQELGGELLEDVDNSLWPRKLIEEHRVPRAPELVRIVIGVDPPSGDGSGSDACGIIAAGKGENGHYYMLDDASVEGAHPGAWARAVRNAYDRWNADRIVAETNQGGAMVDHVLQGAGKLPVRRAWAGKGKSARAEPVAAFYERGEIHHVGGFPALEDEMAGMTIDGRYEGPNRSPDRADALVWALTELIWGSSVRPRIGNL